MSQDPKNSFRSRRGLAIGLAGVAGCTTVVVFLATSQSAGFQTGNAALAGLAVGRASVGIPGAFAEAAYLAGLVTSFVTGGVATGLIALAVRRAGKGSPFVPLLAAETALMAAVALLLGDDPHPAAGSHLVAVTYTAAVAMGLQNAMISHVGGVVVRTTNLTGVLTDLAGELASALAALARAIGDGRPRRTWRYLPHLPAVRRAALLTILVAVFLVGAVLGAVASHYADAAGNTAAALLLPVLFLAGLVVAELLSKMADICPVAAPAVGAVPATVRVFELKVHHRFGRVDHPPDFAAWAARLDPAWRVVILSVGADTGFDADVAASLTAASHRLRADGRSLLVTGLDRAKLRLLGRFDPRERVARRDFPSDVAAAVKRAIALTALSSERHPYRS